MSELNHSVRYCTDAHDKVFYQLITAFNLDDNFDLDNPFLYSIIFSFYLKELKLNKANS